MTKLPSSRRSAEASCSSHPQAGTILFIKAVCLIVFLSFAGCTSENDVSVVSAQSNTSPTTSNTPTQNEIVAAKLKELAEKGNAAAQYNLGMFYNNGIGVKQDPKQAFEWFMKAHNNGDKLGSFKVGCYYAGQYGVVEPDEAKALEFDLVAAESGYSDAQYEVAGIYYNQGKFDESIKWLKKAADQGYPEAMLGLSRVYLEGKVVPKDNVLAYFYILVFDLANSDKYPNPGNISIPGYTITPAEKVRAEKMAKGWKPKLSSLTERANRGMDEAVQLIAESETKN